MADRTGIEWTDATWNPVTGCTKVSAGCEHCYAERITERWHGKGSFADVTLHPERLAKPLSWRTPKRVFVNSMSDLFHAAVPDEFIARVFAQRQVPQVAADRLHLAARSVADQPRQRRASTSNNLADPGQPSTPLDQLHMRLGVLMRQHAEIINSQPPNVEPTPQLVQSTGQWGEWAPDDVQVAAGSGPGPVRHYFPDGAFSRRVGKKSAGRLLDGRSWDEYPEPTGGAQ